MATAKEKMVVFRCANCIDDLKEYNPYVNKANEPIALENVICVEVPQEKCENTDFKLKPILIEDKKSFYDDISFDAQVILLNKAIENALANGYEIQIMIWEGYYEREEGLPIYRSMEEYLEDAMEEEGENINVAETLLYAVDCCFGKGGCVEIVASDDDNDYCLYHQDEEEDYLYKALFDFLELK